MTLIHQTSQPSSSHGRWLYGKDDPQGRRGLRGRSPASSSNGNRCMELLLMRNAQPRGQASCQDSFAAPDTLYRTAFCTRSKEAVLYNSISFSPLAFRYSFAFENGFEPKKPLLAAKGDGCTDSMTKCFERSMCAPFCRA